MGGIRRSRNMCKVVIGRPQGKRPLWENHGAQGHWIVAAVAVSGEILTTHAILWVLISP